MLPRLQFPEISPPADCNGLSAAPDRVSGDWLLWQLADSAFPTGGFAHSGGLEAAWQHGEVRNTGELATFIEASLTQFGNASLPFMTAGFRDPGSLNKLDHLCDSFTSNHVANRASRLQGRALLSSAGRIFGLTELLELGPNGAAPPPHWHLAPIFGVVAQALGLGREPAARLYLFLHLRGLIAGAVRLGIVGPLEAQSLQHRLTPCLEIVMARCQNLPVEMIAQTAPLLELWQGTQDRLYSRLFQS